MIEDRQKRKDEYRKLKLKELQQDQEERVRRFVEGKESLFSQSQYLEFANDMRKYYLKKELADGKDKFLTLDKLMDINDRFKPRDFRLSTNMKPREVKRMLARMMSRPARTSASQTFKTSAGREKFISEDRMSVPVNGNARSARSTSLEQL